jgi:hypothetical protein
MMHKKTCGLVAPPSRSRVARNVEIGMDVKTAVGNAKQWLADVLVDEGISNVGLEEVEFDEQHGVWLITLGFSRPWNTVKNAFTAISGETASGRAYRTIAVKEPSGEVVSMKRREEADN